MTCEEKKSGRIKQMMRIQDKLQAEMILAPSLRMEATPRDLTTNEGVRKCLARGYPPAGV